MGRCKYELLAPLEPALDAIRKIEGLVEKKPGIFYFKSKGFMHFHESDGKIWADIRDGNSWGTPIVVPNKVTKSFCNKFYLSVKFKIKNFKNSR